MADGDDLFAGRPDGPHVVPAADLLEHDDDRPDPLAGGAFPTAAAAGLDRGRVLRVGLLGLALVLCLFAAPRSGIDDTYAWIYVGFVLVFAIFWAVAAGVAFVLGLVGLRSREPSAAPFSWIVVVPLLAIWSLVALGALVDD